MNVILDISADLQVHIEAQIRAGIYSSAVEYFLGLGQQDRQRQEDRIEILRVLHGARDLEGILSTLDEEIWYFPHVSRSHGRIVNFGKTLDRP